MTKRDRLVARRQWASYPVLGAGLLVVFGLAACLAPTDEGVDSERSAASSVVNVRQECGYDVGALPSVTVGDGDVHGLRAKIEHIVVIVQENRSFDHMFAHNPRARASCSESDHGCVEGYGDWRDKEGGPPVRAASSDLGDPGHGWAPMHGALDDGMMDNFYAATGPANKADAISYYLDQDHPFYSWIFNQFATSDAHYAPLPGPTWPDRDYLIWGSAFGMTDNSAGPPKSAVSEGPRDQGVFTQLEGARVSWKLYWSESSGQAIRSPYEGALGWTFPNGGTRCASAAETPYCTTPRATFDSDIEHGTLPAVSFYESSEDEHPGDSGVHSGEEDVRRVMAMIMASPYWDKTAVVLTYDEGGGFFDHKTPPKACDAFRTPNDFSQRGMRIPLIVVSPYAKRGYVSHATSDHASVLRFIQTRWDLPAMTKRDANANALLDMFDFNGAPTAAPVTVPRSALVGDEDENSTLPTSLWNDEIPKDTSPSAGGSFELGLTFASTLAAPRVVGLKYWVGSAPEIGIPHVGRVWDANTAAELKAVTFPEETAQTANTWQTAYFDTPLAIEKARLYMASRNTRAGGVPKSLGYFDAKLHPVFPSPAPETRGNVVTCSANEACATVAFGANGAFGREGAFPTTNSGGTNYWLDVLVK